MNKDRRKAIAAEQDRLEGLLDELREVHDAIETLRDEEEEYRDNMPDSFRDGEKGEAAEAAIEALNEALSALDDFISGDEVKDALDRAAE